MDSAGQIETFDTNLATACKTLVAIYRVCKYFVHTQPFDRVHNDFLLTIFWKNCSANR